jgi:lysophospholipase L1-like esterase
VKLRRFLALVSIAVAHCGCTPSGPAEPPDGGAGHKLGITITTGPPIATSLPPSGTAGGGLGGTYPAPFLTAANQPNPIKILALGDSETAGLPSGGYRQNFWRQLRLSRDDLHMLGPVLGGGDNGMYVLGEWGNRGVGGATMGSTQAALTGYLASDGIPDCLLLMIGSNDLVVGGQTLGGLQTAFTALTAAITAAAPNAQVIVASIPPRLDSGAGPQALGVSYNAWLPTGVAALGPLWHFVDACGGMTQGELKADLLHLNETGSAKAGTAIAAAFESVFPIRRNRRTYPRGFMQRAAPNVARFNTASADFLAITGGSQQPTTATSFAYSLWVRPDALLATPQTILATTGANSGFVLTVSGQTLSFYFDGTEGGWSVSAAPFYQAGQWVRLAVSYHSVDALVAIWANGMLLTVNGISPAPTFTSPNLVVGFSASKGNGFVGNVSEVQAQYGANVPAFASMRDEIETNYFEDAVFPSAAFNFLLNGTLADATGGTAISSNSNTYVPSGLAASSMPIDPASTSAIPPMPAANLSLLLESDVGITGVMGTVVATGTTPPTVTLTGSPVGAPLIEADIQSAGALGTAKFQWKLNGVIQQAGLVTAATVLLGTTGLTVNFAAGTYAADNVYKSTPTVSAWADQSGRGNNAAQATQAKQLTFNATGGPGGYPYLSNPVGLGTILMTGSFATSVTTCTIFVVSAYVAAVSQVPFATNDINTGAAFYYQNPGMSARVNETTLITTPNTEVALDTVFHVHAITADANFVTYYKDGVQRTQIAANGAPVAQTIYTIGQWGTSASYPWKGGIAAIAEYSASLPSFSQQMAHYRAKYATP